MNALIPKHHPDAGHLVDYAAGTLAEPVALLVASHLTFCPHCRAEVTQLEALGGALLETVEPGPVPDGMKERLLGSLDSPAPELRRTLSPPVLTGDGPLPRPLAAKIGRPLDQVKFRRIGPVREYLLGVRSGPYRSKLISMAGGAVMARHTHKGEELSLVLSGGFTDRGEHFLRGDVATAGPDLDHSPVADEGGECLILAVFDAPVKLTGTLGRLLNPFLRY